MRNHESSIVPIEISTSGRFVTPSGDVRRDPKAPVGRVAMESTGVRFDCPEWPHGMTPDPGIPSSETECHGRSFECIHGASSHQGGTFW